MKGIGVDFCAVVNPFNVTETAKTMKQALDVDGLMQIKGIGEVMAAAYVRWFQDPEHLALVEDLRSLVHFQEEEHTEGDAFLEGVTFVITGSLEHFSNRNALRDEIEKVGGKVAGSVSRKTDYLINNDVTSMSGKNKKAQELGVPIIDEETILRWLEKGAIDE